MYTSGSKIFPELSNYIIRYFFPIAKELFIFDYNTQTDSSVSVCEYRQSEIRVSEIDAPFCPVERSRLGKGCHDEL